MKRSINALLLAGALALSVAPHQAVAGVSAVLAGGAVHVYLLKEAHSLGVWLQVPMDRSRLGRGNNGAWMAHRIVEVKRRHDLSVDPQERDEIERLLGSGPDRIIRPAAPDPDRPAADHPPVRTLRNCTEMREVGWDHGVNRDGGIYKSAWDDAERRTYGLNTARDRDKDGHACE